jgi:hypothetical protein
LLRVLVGQAALLVLELLVELVLVLVAEMPLVEMQLLMAQAVAEAVSLAHLAAKMVVMAKLV